LDSNDHRKAAAVEAGRARLLTGYQEATNRQLRIQDHPS
jgi:hypothetical protein